MSLPTPSKFFILLAILCAAVATIGCKGTPIDVAKGRPSDADIPDDVKSDFDQKEPTGWERFAPENIGKTAKKAVGLGPNQKIGEGDPDRQILAEPVRLGQHDAGASSFGKAPKVVG